MIYTKYILFVICIQHHLQTVDLSKKVSEYDQEIPQSHTAGQPMVPGGKATEH